MKNYPSLMQRTLDEVCKAIEFIARARLEDIADRNNFPNIFIGGRKVRKIPTDSNDITGSAEGDFNVTWNGTTGFAYFCVNNAGTITWVRAAVGTF